MASHVKRTPAERQALRQALGLDTDPFAGSTLTCTGTPYSPDLCMCMYHVLTRAFTPPLPAPPRKPFKPPRAFSTRSIYRNTKGPRQKEQLF